MRAGDCEIEELIDGAEMLGIPPVWLISEIGELAQVVAGGTPKSNDTSNFTKPGEGVSWLTPADLSRYNHQFISFGARDISKKGYESCSAKLMPKGSILFSSRAPIGYVVIAANEISTNQGFKSFVFTKDIDSKFAYFYLKSIRNLAESRGSGTTFKELSGVAAKKLPFILVPLAEQQQIAAKLDELLAQVDNLKTRLDTIPKILKRFRQSVLAAAVSGKLTEDWRGMNNINHAQILQETIKKSRTELLNQADKESKRLKNKAESHSFQVPNEDKLPDSWVWTSFMDSMERVIDCHNKTAPYVESGIYLIRTPDIRNGVVSLENTRFVNETTYDYWSRRCPPISGDILFTREAPMGEAGIIPTNTKLCMGQRIMLLRPMPEFTNPKYVLLNILSLPFKERMNKSAVGTAVKHLRVADVESLTYPLAPCEEQTEIVARVEQLFTYAEQIEQRVKDAQARVKHLTQAILARAFSGELTADWRAQNPELISGDNSAAALLARIKAERETIAKPKKTGKKAQA